MDPIAMDLGGRETQVCVRDGRGKILEERRLSTRPGTIRKWLSRRARSRVIVESGSEAFWVADEAKRAGHEVRVVRSTLAPALGVGERGLKTDRRDAAVLSAASVRVDLPSIHIPRRESRDLQARLGMRDAAVRSRTLLINAVRAYLRTIGARIRTGASRTLPRRVREELGSRAEGVEPVLVAIDHLTASIDGMTRDLERRSREDEVARRLQTVPGVGPVTALRFRATLDTIERFPRSRVVASYLGLVPSERSSGDTQRRGPITKAGSSAMRVLLVQAAWRTRPNDPVVRWALQVARRRGNRIAIVALARKLALILTAIWRDGTTYRNRPLRVAA